MTKQIKETKHPDSHYVSQCEPTTVDSQHAILVEGHGIPMNSEVTKDQTKRKHEVGIVELGGPDNRKTTKTKVADRHVQSETGLKTAARRSAYVKEVRSQREKENFPSK